MSKRIPVQICATWLHDSNDFLMNVLCNDGLMWERLGGGEWYPIPPIPQSGEIGDD